MRALLIAIALLGAACGIPENNPPMQAGNDCLSCHNGTIARQWTVAGTLYGDAQSGQDAGVSGAWVIVTDSTGRVLNLATNSVGNFYTAEPLTPPLHVQVETAQKRMAMVSSPASGSCNSCHAQPAAGEAPGRLFVPMQ